jgi:hypothetical protein
VTGPGGKLVQLSTFATLKDSTEPRSLNRFQQLNAAKIQGAFPPGVTLDQALKVLEDAAKDLPKGFSIDYSGESRQLRTEGNKLTGLLVIPACRKWVLLVLLIPPSLKVASQSEGRKKRKNQAQLQDHSPRPCRCTLSRVQEFQIIFIPSPSSQFGLGPCGSCANFPHTYG